MIALKRVYDAPGPDDGLRILVDRLWPRGVKKEAAHLDRWEKELAPSDDLRRWFAHDPDKWAEFRRRFREELADKGALLHELARQGEKGRVTLLYAAKDEEHNNAVVLKELLEEEGHGR
ncbi:DUF488 domain-containing protein [Geomonas terrae]|uniref:DUF488 domain-containing protein n=1 Tax=Geomonas terrae TaxID=2562681 RepID=A0A4S1CGJ5_9BACT|nr:DUF488 domain-containing protein [Geomonas terrae]TGU72210.1 DUF488 domain-containing protein [Geomonas terrae]